MWPLYAVADEHGVAYSMKAKKKEGITPKRSH